MKNGLQAGLAQGAGALLFLLALTVFFRFYRIADQLAEAVIWMYSAG